MELKNSSQCYVNVVTKFFLGFPDSAYMVLTAIASTVYDNFPFSVTVSVILRVRSIACDESVHRLDL